MKRLIKNSENINSYDDVNVSVNTEDMSNLVELDQLSEADIRHDRCPLCQYSSLKREDGFKLCPRCQTVFKVLDGKGYMVNKKN